VTDPPPTSATVKPRTCEAVGSARYGKAPVDVDLARPASAGQSPLASSYDDGGLDRGRHEAVREVGAVGSTGVCELEKNLATEEQCSELRNVASRDVDVGIAVVAFEAHGYELVASGAWPTDSCASLGGGEDADVGVSVGVDSGGGVGELERGGDFGCSFSGLRW
jgi:hypothetical protein